MRSRYPDSAPPITCHALTKRFGERTAVDSLSFDVAPGTVTGFVGANGAGKTTTMRLILGLVAPTAGQALVHGRPYRELEAPRRIVGAAIDGPGAHPSHTARGHLTILATAAGLPMTRVTAVLDLVELTDDANRRVGAFSMGMRQRLALAGAMLGDPPVLMLDEPVNGLDPPGIIWMRELLKRLADEGRAVLVSSHLLAELAEVADRMVIIDHGRLVADTTLADLLADRAPRVELICAHPAAAATALRPLATAVSQEGGMLIIDGVSAREVGEAVALADAGPVHRLSERAGTFEDVYFELAGSPTDAAAVANDDLVAS
jgi:ABC-2 type transport system ATP-binding protein